MSHLQLNDIGSLFQDCEMSIRKALDYAKTSLIFPLICTQNRQQPKSFKFIVINN